jgi:hypothetical protein
MRRSRWVFVGSVLGLVVLVVGVALYSIGDSDAVRSDTLSDIGVALVWVSVAAIVIGLVLLAVYALTRLVVWSARR